MWLVALVSVAGCTKPTPATSPVKASPVKAAGKPARTAATSPAAVTGKEAAKKEAAVYRQRRKPKPTVVGGCEESCGTPQKAAAALFDGLSGAKPRAVIKRLIDWSLLDEDGNQRGERWSDLWVEPKQHPIREREISIWLGGWIAQFADVSAADLLRSRSSGVQLKAIAGRTDVVEMRWRHPPLNKGGGEPEWRILWTLRGYEWLISRIDTAPSKRPLGTPPLGSVRRGHL
ncbi:MAG: hypothetical protein KC502_00255 [Myxococcales bacterium]|nr:hypothetical protein [Myxococcales bacterium]